MQLYTNTNCICRCGFGSQDFQKYDNAWESFLTHFPKKCLGDVSPHIRIMGSWSFWHICRGQWLNSDLRQLSKRQLWMVGVAAMASARQWLGWPSSPKIVVFSCVSYDPWFYINFCAFLSRIESVELVECRYSDFFPYNLTIALS